MRAVCDPILEEDALWRPYMSRHRQNYAWQYHNGGMWPFVGGFYVGRARAGRHARRGGRGAPRSPRANALDGWAIHRMAARPHARAGGMRGQSWNAAAFLDRARGAAAQRVAVRCGLSRARNHVTRPARRRAAIDTALRSRGRAASSRSRAPFPRAGALRQTGAGSANASSARITPPTAPSRACVVEQEAGRAAVLPSVCGVASTIESTRPPVARATGGVP